MKKHLPILPTNPLPPLYAGWMDQLLAGPIPHETNATCDDCAMCSPEHPEGSDSYFNTQTKCCTYLPALPNYLVGRILGDADPAFAEGRDTVLARLRAGVAVTPLGLACSPVFELLYGHNPKVFGHSRSLRCPHYLENGGRCGMWKHRASVCATWFCKYVRGEVGRDFWLALHRLLSTVERSLSSWCVLELDVGETALNRLFPPPMPPDPTSAIDGKTLDGKVDPAAYRVLWGNWLGREVPFYQACAERVNALTWQQVSAIGGPGVHIAAKLVQVAHRKLLSEEMPAALGAGSFQIHQLALDTARVSAYSPSDPLELPRELLEVLRHFDGRSTGDVLDDIQDETGIEIHPELVRKLADFGILVPSESLTRNAGNARS
jgi:hypothetical protein